MQTDPNPANFFFDSKNDKLNLIDFGACHSYSTEFMDKYIEIIKAATVKDVDSIIEYSR